MDMDKKIYGVTCCDFGNTESEVNSFSLTIGQLKKIKEQREEFLAKNKDDEYAYDNWSQVDCAWTCGTCYNISGDALECFMRELVVFKREESDISVTLTTSALIAEKTYTKYINRIMGSPSYSSSFESAQAVHLHLELD